MEIREVEKVIFTPDGVVVIPLQGKGEEPITFHARYTLVEFRILKDLSQIIIEMQRKLQVEVKPWV